MVAKAGSVIGRAFSCWTFCSRSFSRSSSSRRARWRRSIRFWWPLSRMMIDIQP